MKIQLLNDKNKVLYELEQSELFPDYRSVLREAIALNLDLTGLRVESESLDEVTWNGASLTGVSFLNCSMKKNEFQDCTVTGLYLHSCDLSSSKFRKTTLRDFHLADSKSAKVHFSDCQFNNSFILSSSLSDARFYECGFFSSVFNSTGLSGSIFKNCTGDTMRFVHSKQTDEWLKDTFFMNCRLHSCEMDIEDLACIYFWNTNVRDIQLLERERFTEVINDNSQVLYAIDSDVVWWKPYSWKEHENKIFRGTLAEFFDEVHNGFPTTDLYPEMDDTEIEEELLRVCQYLKSWKNPTG
ncbi:pentapeptide repeat-containing protein [Gaoshiqia sediminis]|uniref:Pentapeptide repeat-containing protein n=1 Tax=Gaoshiqia sediminis TaxID=2986998 RepID=A0AA42C782_9BACT|nr:pentapeptide repeat-containing protein [Gaoshiqia sediminis]MCW0483319.1 pentapeptide repeat-containing protein [Gaoshiqia sediminis]